MEAAIALFASTAAPAATTAITGGTALALGVAPAVTTAAGGLFAGVSASTLISGGLSVVSALGSIGESQAQATALESQALMEDFNARQEILKGKQEQIAAQTELNDVLAANVAGGFARGLTGAGSVAGASEEAIRKSEQEIDITRQSAKIRAGQRRAQGREFRTEAAAKRTTGLFKAATTIGKAGLRISERGTV